MRLYHSQCSTCPLFLFGLFLFFCGPVLLRWFPFLTAEAATIAVLILFPFFPGSCFFSTLHVGDIFPLYSEVTRSKAGMGSSCGDGVGHSSRGDSVFASASPPSPPFSSKLLFPGALALSFEFFLFFALPHHLLDALLLSFLFAQFPESGLLLLLLALELPAPPSHVASPSAPPLREDPHPSPCRAAPPRSRRSSSSSSSSPCHVTGKIWLRRRPRSA